MPKFNPTIGIGRLHGMASGWRPPCVLPQSKITDAVPRMTQEIRGQTVLRSVNPDAPALRPVVRPPRTGRDAPDDFDVCCAQPAHEIIWDGADHFVIPRARGRDAAR